MCFSPNNIKGSFKDTFQNGVISISNVTQGLSMMGGSRKISQLFIAPDSIAGVSREEPSECFQRAHHVLKTPCLLQETIPI